MKSLGISDETLTEIKEFFLRTSVPRIIEEYERGELDCNLKNTSLDQTKTEHSKKESA